MREKVRFEYELDTRSSEGPPMPFMTGVQNERYVR